MRPSRPRFYISSPERAPQDVRAMLIATEESEAGEYAYPNFTSIQRIFHQDALLHMPPEKANNFLRELRETYMASLARACRARFDPTALKGFDYRNVDLYLHMMDRINQNPKLRDLPLEGLFTCATRSVKAPDAVRRVILFDQSIKDQFKKYTYKTRTKRDPNTPRPKKLKSSTPKKPRAKKSAEKNTPIIDSQPKYIDIHSSEYKLTSTELLITKSLLTIHPDNPQIYLFPQSVDLARHLQDTQGTNVEQALGSIDQAVLRIPPLYLRSMSLIEAHGSLPTNASETTKLLEYLDQYRISVNGVDLYPYKKLGIKLLTEVLSRRIQPPALLVPRS